MVKTTFPTLPAFKLNLEFTIFMNFFYVLSIIKQFKMSTYISIEKQKKI